MSSRQEECSRLAGHVKCQPELDCGLDPVIFGERHQNGCMENEVLSMGGGQISPHALTVLRMREIHRRRSPQGVCRAPTIQIRGTVFLVRAGDHDGNLDTPMVRANFAKRRIRSIRGVMHAVSLAIVGNVPDTPQIADAPGWRAKGIHRPEPLRKESVMQHGSPNAPEVTGDVKPSSAIIARAEADRRRSAIERIDRALDELPQHTWSASEAESIATTFDGMRAGRLAAHTVGDIRFRRLRLVD